MEPSGRPAMRRAQALANLVAPGGVYGYDLEVHVGLERHLRHQQREEVCGELLREHDISLSTGQESLLAARFVEHLEALHWKRAPQLAEAMREDGGYPMNIDATGEDGRGTTFVVYNSWRHWALGAWKISTERADLVLPRLQQTVQAFGKADKRNRRRHYDQCRRRISVETATRQLPGSSQPVSGQCGVLTTTTAASLCSSNNMSPPGNRFVEI